MSELVVYGNVGSPPSRSVLFFLRVSNINHEFKALNPSSSDVTSEEFTKINPFQSIPAIAHNDFSLWESAAIVPYLAESFNVDNQWYPKDPKVRGRINAYLHWHHQNIRGPLSAYVIAKVFGPKLMGTPELTEEQERPYKESLKNWFETFEWLIADTGFVARTQTATVADVFAFNELNLALYLPINLDDHPKVKTWYDSIASNSILQELIAEALELIRQLNA